MTAFVYNISRKSFFLTAFICLLGFTPGISAALRLQEAVSAASVSPPEDAPSDGLAADSSAAALHLNAADDTLPAIITNVKSSNITSTAATITWQTDEHATSVVEYGLTTAYGTFSAFNGTHVTAHSIVLRGLMSSTKYHFRVRSRDLAGNVAVSGDFNFTTAHQVLLSDNFPGPALDVNKWNMGSNSGNQTVIENGALTLRSSASQSGWVITKRAFAGANKNVQLKIVKPSDDCALGMSPTVNLTSANAIYSQKNWYRFYVYRDGHAGKYLFYVQRRRNGVVDGIDVGSGLTPPSSFYLRLRTDAAHIIFEYSPDKTNWTTLHQETFALPGYSLSDGYFYEISGNDTPLNGIMRVDDFVLSSNVPPPDKEAPVISEVAATNITSTSAKITWRTNEVGDSQVQYGPTTGYGLQSPLDSIRATTHSVTLNNLNGSTTYHYRVNTRDAAGNLATSNDFTFTTLVTPLFGDDFNASTLNLNKWVKGSNSGNEAGIANQALQLRSLDQVTAWIVTKQKFAARNTAVSVRVAQPNDDGNLGMSPTYKAASPNGISGEAAWYRFYIYRTTASGPYKLFVQWKKNGVVDGIDVTGNAVLEGSFHLRLRCDDTRIYFEFSLNGQAWTTAHSEPFGLPGYTPASAFHYELAAYSTNVKGILKVDDFAIRSTSGADTKPPVISQVASGNIAATSATLTWATDEASDSQVEFGKTISYGSSSPLNATPVKAHSVQLTNLAANTTYHYRVKSKDAAGNLATSNDFTFTTTGAATTLFSDNFNLAALDLSKWTKGSNSGNQASVDNNALKLRSTGAQAGWIVTKNKYAARKTTVTVKVVQPNNDGDLGMTPAFQASSANGIFTQPNWYRFYVYREVNSGPYRLYAQWSKNGTVNGLDVTGNMNITGVVYLRLRFDDTRIHFEASLNGQSWTDTYTEVFALPGYTLNSSFNYELAGNRTELNGQLTVDDFIIASTGSALAKSEGEEASGEAALPTAFALSQNYPNPFYFNTHVRLALPEEAQVYAAIYDLNGREVRQLHQGAITTGYRVINWDGSNAGGQQVSSGVYFMRVIFETQAGGREVMTRQLRLMR